MYFNVTSGLCESIATSDQHGNVSPKYWQVIFEGLSNEIHYYLAPIDDNGSPYYPGGDDDGGILIDTVEIIAYPEYIWIGPGNGLPTSISNPYYTEPTNPGGGDGGGGGGSNPGGSTPTAPSQQQILNQIQDKPFALFDSLDCDIIRKWIATAKHEVAQAQITKLNTIVNTTTTRPGITTTTVARLQDINNAYSQVVNMDYFPITISQMPIINGVRQTPEQFLEYIRKNINSFVNTNYAEFEPYQWYGIDETTLWNSSNPLGAVIGIDIKGPDNGSVIVTNHSSSGWTFSTIFDPKYGAHPVSGHRDFGFEQNIDGSYTFYTRGVDRLTSVGESKLEEFTRNQSGRGYPFQQSDALWESFQNKIVAFVNNNSGVSFESLVKLENPDWQKIKDVIDGKLPLSTLSTDCDD